MPNRLLEQTPISILSWNPGPRRGREGAIEELIAGKWYVKLRCRRRMCTFNTSASRTITILPTLLDVLSLFNTLHSDIQVNSVYFHGNRNGQHQAVREGQSGWVLQAVISRASVRWIPRNGQSCFTMMSLHIDNQFETWDWQKLVSYSPYCNVSRTG